MREFEPGDFSMDAEMLKWLRRPTIYIANLYYMFATVGLVVASLIGAALYQAFPALGTTGANAVNAILFEVGALALPTILYAVKRPGVHIAMRLNPPSVTSLIVAALAAVVGVFLFNNIGVLWMLVVQGLGGDISATTGLVPATSEALTASVLLTGMLPGVCEELMFRGFLLGAWERRGTRYAWVVSSVLFACMHASVLGLPVHLLVSFALGYLVIVSDSLYTGMVYHTVHNAVLLMLSYAQAGLDNSAAYENLYGYLGGISGVLLLVLETAFLLLCFLGVLAFAYAVRMRKELPFSQIARGDRTPMRTPELLFLLAGLVTVGLLYGYDLLIVFGVL